MAKIKSLHAREILDSRGNPTVEVTVETNTFSATASVPSGASTGSHEALELRDGGKRFAGKGVQTAVHNVNTKIAPKLRGVDCCQQEKIDNLLLALDGTKNKSKLGANALLGVSLACARAGAKAKKIHLFKYIHQLLTLPDRKMRIPLPFFNIINGGKHADNELSFQEFMIAPQFAKYQDNLRASSEIYHVLKKQIHSRYGKGSTNVGDEGGFAPEELRNSSEALKMITSAIRTAGYTRKVKIGIDCAASEFFRQEKDGEKYKIDGKKLSSRQLHKKYQDLIKQFPIISLEDPFHQDDFQSFANLLQKTKIQVVGDDLTVTTPKRIEKAIKENSCNCLLLKLNQIGTVTEALQAAQMAYNAGWKVMVSHRSGETEDTFIADFAVGIGADMVKFGAPARGERTAKYNQLLRIEEAMTSPKKPKRSTKRQ